MNWHAPSLTPAHGFYAFIALAAVLAIGWVFDWARKDKPKQSDNDDPVERLFKDI